MIHHLLWPPGWGRLGFGYMCDVSSFAAVAAVVGLGPNSIENEIVIKTYSKVYLF